MAEAEQPAVYAVAAEFAAAGPLLAAAARLRERGFVDLDAATPVPVEGLGDLLGLSPPRLGLFAWAGGAAGLALCFGMIIYATVFDYRFDIGGRPLVSWPAYIVPCLAVASAAAAIAVFVGMLFLDRLPRLNHPTFNIDGIERATRDRYFIIVEARSDDFDAQAVEATLAELPDRPLTLQRVPR